MDTTMKNTTFFTKRLLTTSIVSGLFATMMMATVPAQANNPNPTIKADAPNRYIVKKGDTLWDISGKYLKNPARWKEIWATNKQVKNPHLIYPKDVLILCIIKGKTLVGVDTGEGCAGIEKQVTGNVTPKKVAVRPVNSHIKAFPLQNIRYWLDKVAIVNPEDYKGTPYVLASKNGNLVTAEGDKIYVKGVPLTVGQTYGVYRASNDPYIDPRTKRVVGLEVRQVASGLVVDTAPNRGISSIKLRNSYGYEVREGDRVFIEMNNDLPPAFYPKPAQVDRPGQIIRVMGTIGAAAANGVVAINLGKANNARIGDVLTVYKKGKLVRDTMDDDMPVRLPSEEAGNLMIFKVFDNISYAYVLDSEVPLNVGDKLLSSQD